MRTMCGHGKTSNETCRDCERDAEDQRINAVLPPSIEAIMSDIFGRLPHEFSMREFAHRIAAEACMLQREAQLEHDPFCKLADAVVLKA